MLEQKTRISGQQVVRFGLVGLLNTGVDYGLYNLAFHMGVARTGPALALTSLACICPAALLSYTLNRRWTFRSPDGRTGLQAMRFAVATVLGMLLNSLAVWAYLAASPFALPALAKANVAKLVGGGLSSVWNFVSYRLWVFRSHPPYLLEQAATPTASTSVPPHGERTQGRLVSIVIPAFNEERRLPERLERLATALPDLFPVEIIVVNDGSTDGTARALSAVASRHSNIRLLGYECNRGKGAAVSHGVMASSGDLVVYTDADETFTEEHILQVVTALQGGPSLVVGTRNRSAGCGTEGEPLVRSLMGRAFSHLVQLLVLPGVSDTQCGLKGFSGSLARTLFREVRTQGFAFDVEVLVRARSMGIKPLEVPVVARDCPGSHVNGLLAPFQMLADILRIRIREQRLARKPDPLRELGSASPRGMLAVCMALFVVALAIRLPWLQQVPRYFDEMKEVSLGLAISQGHIFPLHNVAADIGAMHNYILAAGFWLFGPNMWWPRVYTAVTGALTVPLVYLLGREIEGPWTGGVAALVLATNGMHILVTHKAWANCTTPFFALLAILAMTLAERRRQGWWLVAAGLLWALTLQTHSSVIVYILAASAYMLSRGFRQRSGLGSRWYWGAALAFLVGYANMVIYNIASRGGSVKWIFHKGYTMEAHPGIRTYLGHLDSMVVELVRTVGSIYSSRPHVWSYLTHPGFVLCLALIIYGCREVLRRKAGLLVIIVATSLLVIPWINTRYTFYVLTRYIMTVAVAAIVLASLGAVTLVRALASRLERRHRRYVFGGSCAVVALVLCLQLGFFYAYCNRLAGTNDSNTMPLHAVEKVKAWVKSDATSRATHTAILVSYDLPIAFNPVPYLLALSAIPAHTVSPRGWRTALRGLDAGQRVIAVVGGGQLPLLRRELQGGGPGGQRGPEVARYSCQRVFPPYRDTPYQVSLGTTTLYVVRGTMRRRSLD